MDQSISMSFIKKNIIYQYCIVFVNKYSLNQYQVYKNAALSLAKYLMVKGRPQEKSLVNLIRRSDAVLAFQVAGLAHIMIKPFAYFM